MGNVQELEYCRLFDFILCKMVIMRAGECFLAHGIKQFNMKG